MKQVKTCMNCKYAEWEAWFPTIKVWCYVDGKRTGGVDVDTVCERHVCKEKALWKDRWSLSEAYPGQPYEAI